MTNCTLLPPSPSSTEDEFCLLFLLVLNITSWTSQLRFALKVQVDLSGNFNKRRWGSGMKRCEVLTNICIIGPINFPATCFGEISTSGISLLGSKDRQVMKNFCFLIFWEPVITDLIKRLPGLKVSPNLRVVGQALIKYEIRNQHLMIQTAWMWRVSQIVPERFQKQFWKVFD